MTRVLFVGQSYVVAESRKKLAELARLGHEVSLIVPATWEHADFGRYPFQSAAWDAGLAIYPIPVWQNGRAFAFAYAPGPLWRAVRQARAQIVQVEQEPGSLALFQLTLLTHRPAARLLAFTWENLYYRQPGVRHYLERFELARLDHLLAGSTGAAAVFRRKGYQGPLTVLPNVGVDPEQFSPQPAAALRQALGLGPDFVVGFAGRLVPEKGCADLMRAFGALPVTRSRLLLLGAGPERAALAKLADELGVAERVLFQPAVPHSEVPRYLNAMDCLVLPSRTVPNGWREQFGLVLAQAMACGVPVIGSDSGAIPEVIASAGLTFPEGDVPALNACLGRLEADPRLRAELGALGRARVLAHYTPRRLAEQTHGVYQPWIASRP